MGAHVSVPMYRRSLAERLALTADQCRACGAVAFPRRPRCPSCGADHLVSLRLSGRGVVHACTRIGHGVAPPEFDRYVAAAGPYFVGIVTLEEGPRITGMLVDFDRAPEIGTQVGAVTRRLYTEEGVVRYGFKFAPAAKVDSSV